MIFRVPWIINHAELLHWSLESKVFISENKDDMGPLNKTDNKLQPYIFKKLENHIVMQVIFFLLN